MAFQEEWQEISFDSTTQFSNNHLTHKWQNSKDSGNVYLKLTVRDHAGNFASDTTSFLLDNEAYQKPMASISYPDSNAYLHDLVQIRGYATDENFLKYSIILKHDKWDTLLIESDDPKKENEVLYTLDTDSFPDDNYKICLTVLNNKQYHHTDIVPVTIDNTPPVAKIEKPAVEVDTISCFVTISGEATDDNLTGFTLKHARVGENDPSKFVLIDTSFSIWNTMGLNGYYTLYLTVTDHGGLTAIYQRSIYIDNPIFEKSDGLEKRMEEFSLYIPPNGYKSAVICIEKKTIYAFGYDPLAVTPTKLICQIHSNIDEKKFYKPTTFKINYGDIDFNEFEENKLAVFHWENNGWHFVGGTVDKDNKVISTAIEQIGVYGLFERKKAADIIANDLKLACQPRVFSPRGGGYKTETNLTINLEKDCNVTIKIFNLAGRLVKILCEHKPMTMGSGSISWNGLDNDDRYCVSGLYVVLFQAGGKEATQTVMVLNK